MLLLLKCFVSDVTNIILCSHLCIMLLLLAAFWVVERKWKNKIKISRCWEPFLHLYKWDRLHLCLSDWFKFAGFNTVITASQITTGATRFTISICLWTFDFGNETRWNLQTSLFLFSLPAVWTVFPPDKFSTVWLSCSLLTSPSRWEK